MHHRHVLVVEEFASTQDTRLWQDMSANGIDVVRVPLDRTAEAVRNGLRPEAIILNMTAAEMAGVEGRYRDTAERLVTMHGRHRLPIIALGTPCETTLPAGVTEIGVGGRSPTQIIRRIAALSRLATMHGELARRDATDDSFGVPPPRDESPLGLAGARVLVVGDGPLFLSIQGLVSRFAEVVGAMTRQMTLEFLSRVPFSAVILAMPQDAALEVIDALRHHPSHFDLPVVVVPDGGEAEDYFARGVHEVITADRLGHDLSRAVRGLAAEHLFRGLLRAGYRTDRSPLTNEADSGVFNAAYLERHLARCLTDCLETGEAFSLAGFEVLAEDVVEGDAVIAPHEQVMRQVGLMMSRICRAEDMVARLDDRFMLMLPGTWPDDATTPVQRIASIVHTTRIVLDDGTHARIQMIPRIIALDPAMTVAEHLEYFRD